MKARLNTIALSCSAILALELGLGSHAHAQIDGWRLDRGTTEQTASTNIATAPLWVRRWKVDLGSPIRASAVIGYNRIIVGTDGGDVIAVRPKDGKRLWTHHVGSPVSTSVAIQMLKDVPHPIVWFSAENGTLYALNGATGALLWNLAGGGQTWNSPPNYQVPRRVFYTYATGVTSRLRAVEAVTGQILWDAPQGVGNISPQTPTVIHSQNLVIQAYAQVGRQIKAFRTNDGQFLWSLNSSTVGSGMYTSAAVYGAYNRLIVSLRPASVEAYNINNQLLVWSASLPQNGPVLGLAAPFRGVGSIVVAQANALHSVDSDTGNILWSITHSGNLIDGTTRRTPMPAIHGNIVVHVENANQLVGRRLGNGQEVWAFALQGEVVASPAVAQQVAVIGTKAGFLYLFARCKC